jgi:hypothetical protein
MLRVETATPAVTFLLEACIQLGTGSAWSLEVLLTRVRCWLCFRVRRPDDPAVLQATAQQPAAFGAAPFQ